MKQELKLVRIDSKYCDYLRKFDSKVPYNFDKKELRPFVGVLFEIEYCKYFAPLSSPKPKHLKIKNSIDFLRIDKGNLGAINFNNMLPVAESNIIIIDLDEKTKNKKDEKYQKLLKEQIYWLNRNDEKLYNRSKKLYEKYINNTLDKNIRERCCNFKLLEQKCLKYNKIKKTKNMIDINKAKISFKEFLKKYEIKNELGFDLKVQHTYQVVNNAKLIATKLNLSEEDILLAELIGLLHDIGRFEELTFLKEFDSVKFDHASYGIKMLFEDNMIRDFIDDDSYDEVIKIAIDNHSRLSIQENIDERSLLHAKIIRDADKLDNYRVKKDEKIEANFPGRVKDKSELENSFVTDKVFETIKENKCVDIHDRKTILDYWVCVLAFIFDINFKETLEIIKEKNYINILIDRFTYTNEDTKDRMETIRKLINKYIEDKLK